MAAMIIGFTLLVITNPNSAFAQTSLANIPPPTLLKNGLQAPDKVTFRIRMELGDIEQARRWLEAGLDPNFMGDRLGTGLHIAAWNGNIPLMALFHAHGARLDENNSNDEQALHLASYKGQHAAAEWLLAHGAPVSQPNNKPTWTPLHYAAFAGHMDLVNRFLAKGADINALSPNGSTPLMAAIYEGRTQLAEHLLRQGADRDIKNDWGDGALEWAMKFNQTQLARLLTDTETFAAAASQPKSAWTAQRSQATSPELLSLLDIRESLVKRGLSTRKIDNRIAAQRAQEARAQHKINPVPTTRLDALEIRPTQNQIQRRR